MSPGPKEPPRLRPQGSFFQEKQTGGLGQKMLSRCSLKLLWTPVWLVVVCPGSRANW